MCCGCVGSTAIVTGVTRKPASPPSEDDGIPIGLQKWSGRDGLARLQERLDCSAPVPERFRARLRTGIEQDLALVEWRSTSLSARWLPNLLRPRICLTVVLEGDARWQTGSAAWSADGRGVAVLRCAGRTGFELPRGGLLRSLLMPVDLLPAHLRAGRPLREGGLPATTLVRAFAVTLQEAFGAALEAGRVPAGLPVALRGLATAVLEEAGDVLAPEDQPLREQILAHVERHLGDAALGPQTIATSLGVSLRWVHQAFAGHGTTVGRHIRARRAEAVAQHVRTLRVQPRLDALAPRFGFGGRDQMTRAFTARFGVGVGEYWSRHALEGMERGATDVAAAVREGAGERSGSGEAGA